MIDWVRLTCVSARRHVDLQDKHLALQDKHLALQDEHLALQDRYEALQDAHIEALTELKRLYESAVVGADSDGNRR